jgi:hypothetical protein
MPMLVQNGLIAVLRAADQGGTGVASTTHALEHVQQLQSQGSGPRNSIAASAQLQAEEAAHSLHITSTRHAVANTTPA